MRTALISNGECCPYCGSTMGFSSIYILRQLINVSFDGVTIGGKDGVCREVVYKGKKGKCLDCEKHFRIKR